MLYTDGIQLAKSSRLNFWPVFVSVCELPPSIRESKRNKIIFGVWSGQNKPNTNVLFDGLVRRIAKLSTEGLECSLEKDKLYLTIGAYGFLGDTPAKALVMNIMNFNGEYGCPYCLNPGKQIFCLIMVIVYTITL